VEKNTTLTITGYNKVVLGDFCATIRMQRPPEPYKGKGIRWAHARAPELAVLAGCFCSSTG
jgi:ribosomal protein L6P/L9E